MHDHECIILDSKLLNVENLEVKNIIVVPDEWRGYSTKSQHVFIHGKLSDIIIYWTGNTSADTDEFLTCVENL